MMLVNEKLANKTVATIYGDIKFNGKGETKDLTVAQRKDLGKLPGFKYVEEKKAPAKEEPTKKASTKKEPAKKAPAKKAPAKKETKKDNKK